ncbi:MAG: hypothetical protein H7243_04175 [Sphingomonadaceae bacterium]|nr:hypothetical protein [Sphingomonadaceae bacterium]
MSLLNMRSTRLPAVLLAIVQDGDSRLPLRSLPDHRGTTAFAPVFSRWSTLASAMTSARIELAADLINALDSHDYEIEYYYASRLANEPPDGVNDRHLKPIEPRQLRLSATVRF